MAEFLNSWVDHYGWLWMLIGLLGFIVVVVGSDS